MATTKLLSPCFPTLSPRVPIQSTRVSLSYSTVVVTDPDSLWLVWYSSREEEMNECRSATSVLSAASFLAVASAAFLLFNSYLIRKLVSPMMTLLLVVFSIIPLPMVIL